MRIKNKSNNKPNKQPPPSPLQERVLILENALEGLDEEAAQVPAVRVCIDRR
jgi:hypothetical protein